MPKHTRPPIKKQRRSSATPPSPTNRRRIRLTALSTEWREVTYLRGYSLLDLAAHDSFGHVIFLLLLGRRPTSHQRRALDAVLVSAIDHGPLAPSADVARRVASTGNSLNTAVAAGVAALGDYHGGAIEQAGRLLTEATAGAGSMAARAERLVANGLAANRRLPGFGHRLYRTDRRVANLFRLAAQEEVPNDFIRLARATERALEKAKGKKIPLNIDGAMAAVLLGLGFPWHLLRGVFIIARTPGLVAQAWEQIQREPPVLRSQEELIYDGPSLVPPRVTGRRQAKRRTKR